MDELREVLDRVRVVVRGRRDELDAGGAAARRRDVDGDLRRGQLTALAGLRALPDLDLQLFQHRVGEIARPDAEPAGRELLDPGAADGAVPGVVLAALAAVRHRADHVRAVRDGLVRGRDQRAVAHRAGGERAGDLVGRLYVGESDAVGGVVEEGEEAGGGAGGGDQDGIRIRLERLDLAGVREREAVGEGGVALGVTVEAQPDGHRSRGPVHDGRDHAPDRDARVAARGEAAQLTGEVLRGAQPGDIGGQREHIPQRGKYGATAPRAWSAGRRGTRGDPERVDLGVAEGVVPGVAVRGVGDAERVVELAEGEEAERVRVATLPARPARTGRPVLLALLVLSAELRPLLGHVAETAYGRDTEGVPGAVRPLLEQPEQRDLLLGLHGTGPLVPLGRGLRDPREADPAHRGLHVREGPCEHVVAGVEVVGLEERAADVTLGGAQPDAPHGLGERLLGRLAEPRQRPVGLGDFTRGRRCARVPLLGPQPRTQAVDRRSTEAERGGDVVRRRQLPALRDDRDAQPQPGLDEALVRRRDREDHRQRRTRGGDPPVGEDRDAAPFRGEPLDIVAEPLKRRPERVGVRGLVPGDRVVEHVEPLKRNNPLVAQPHHVEMPQHGRGDDELTPADAPRAVRLGSEGDPHAHAVGLADAVQRRVRDLREPLREVLRHAALGVAERVDGVAVAHRRDPLRPVGEHRVEHEPEALLVQRVRHVPAREAQVAVVAERRGAAVVVGGGQVVEVHPGRVEQFGVRPHGRRGRRAPRAYASGARRGGRRRACPCGLDTPPVHDLLVGEGDLPGLRRHHEVLGGLDGTQRTQPEPVEAGADDVPVAEDDGGGPVVLLFIEGEVLQHVADGDGQGAVVLPGGRHEGHDGLDEVEPVVEHPALQGLVEAAGVGLPGGRTMLRVRARARASSLSRFLRSVFSSPLCAMRRNG